MLLSELEHILRAAGAIANEKVMIVIGSQAILGSLAEPPAELTVSREADLYPRDAPHKSDLITGSIGEFSLFHETFGYHGDGVSPETAVLPEGWRERLVELSSENTNGVVGLCLSSADIAISKLVAGRQKDLDYVAALVAHRLVDVDELLLLAATLDIEPRQLVEMRLKSLAQGKAEGEERTGGP